MPGAPEVDMLNVHRKLTPVQRKKRLPRTIIKKMRKPTIASMTVKDHGLTNGDVLKSVY